ncbi:MAG: hypothetical protein ACRDT4_10010 [Micromonosporaceae bacterium]
MYTDETAVYYSATSPITARHRRRIVVALFAAAALLGVAAGWWMTLPPASPGAVTDMSAEASPSGSPSPAPASPTQASPAASGKAAPPPGQPAGGGSAGDADNTSGAPPSGPCHGLSDEQKHHLVVTPDELYLKPNATKGSFLIYNCGDAPIVWKANSEPYVHLEQTEGALAGGHHLKLYFTVDTDELADGPYSFSIKLSEPDSEHHAYVTVHGTKLSIALGD